MGWIAAATLLLDQATKLAAAAWLPGAGFVVVVPGLLNLAYAVNTGAAFSMFTGWTAALAAVNLVIGGGVVVWAVRLTPEEHGLRSALGLILGGAVGNLIDRIRLGHVIDFIDAHWFWKAHWPTFNIADSAVCIGMALLVIASFRTPAPSPQAAGNAGEQGRPADAGRR
jgi:signal peptidase II